MLLIVWFVRQNGDQKILQVYCLIENWSFLFLINLKQSPDLHTKWLHLTILMNIHQGSQRIWWLFYGRFEKLSQVAEKDNSIFEQIHFNFELKSSISSHRILNFSLLSYVISLCFCHRRRALFCAFCLEQCFK